MAQSERTPTVLLIDDSVDVHRLLRVRLRYENVEFVSAMTGADGLRLACEVKPASILLDLDMPDIDGFELLRALKEDASTRNVPVIVLTGLHRLEDKVTAFDLGATDYVTKPFDLAELRARMRATLRLHHLLTLLAERAEVDGLTGLGNRAAFDKRWREAVASCRRHHQPLSLVLLDIDHFKQINDTYGHPAGDAVLQGFASLLQEHCRVNDSVFRHGGEEFSLIMPQTATAAAQAVSDRIRASLQTQEWRRHPDRAVTVSVGLAGTDGTVCMEACEWIELADRNLYAAKNSGRNTTVASDLSGFKGRFSLAG